MGYENSQIEGFFFGLLTGVVKMSVMHYLIVKIVGPLLFVRLWCGWTFWTVMVLDLENLGQNFERERRIIHSKYLQGT